MRSCDGIDGIPVLLAVEVAFARRSAEGAAGDPPADPGHEPGEPAVESIADSWRVVEAWIEIAQSTIAKYMAKRRPESGQTWKTFVRNHAAGIGAMDFLVVPTINFRLFVLVILRHERRRLISLSVTDHPTAEWIARQIAEAFPWDSAPTHLIRDRDAFCGQAVTKRLSELGIRDHPAAARSPWRNGHAERLIGSIHRECLDHIVVFGEVQLGRVLTGYAGYYNEFRTHVSLGKDSPSHRPVLRFGQIAAQPIPGGLHYQYCRMQFLAGTGKSHRFS